MTATGTSRVTATKVSKPKSNPLAPFRRRGADPSEGESKQSAPPKRLSAVADPLSEDEFEQEVKQETKAYSAFQRNQAERAQIKEENKIRRKQGLDVLKLPTALKEPRRSLGVSDGEQRLEGSSEESEASVGKGGKRKKRRRADDELRFEGEVRLPFNPLYVLAGMRDPHASKAALEDAKQALLDRHLKVDGIGDDNALAGPSSPRVEPKEEEAVVEEEEEVPEGDYEGEDEVIAPWTSVVPAADPEVDGEEEEEAEEVEGVYSDDEQYAPEVDSKSSQIIGQSATLTQADDLPPYRPMLPFEPANPVEEPYQIDPTSPDITVPQPINRYLKDYQRAGAKFLFEKYKQGSGGVLGDDMGLGKTIQVISFLSAIMRKTSTRQDYRRRKKLVRQSAEEVTVKHWPTALIICPSSLVRNWERELDTWGYFEHATWTTDNWQDTSKSYSKGFLDLLLVSYEAARNTIDHLRDLPFSVLVVDEAHRLKEPTASRTLAVKKIKASSCFALTGTLIQNRMEEMWSVLDFVQRGWAGTLKEWREFAVNPIKRGHRHEGSVHDVVTGIMRLGVMYQKILPHFYLRRDKRLIAHELPEKRDLVVFCPLAPRQVEAYRRLIESEGIPSAVHADGEDVQFILRRKEQCDCEAAKKSKLTRLECCYKTNSEGDELTSVVLKNMAALGKVANHFGLLYHAKDDSPHTREINSRFFEICTGHSYDQKDQSVVQAALDPDNCGKWKLLSQLLRDWRAEPVRNKVLIFSNSVRLLKMIGEFISTSLAGFEFDVFTGEVGRDERMNMVDRFQNPELDQFILLISTQAGGVGLNLTAANKVVIFDPDWNPANDLQAMDRAFRIGQQRTVDVYRLIGQGTLEELKYERQIHKQQRSRQLNDGTFERRIHQGMEGGRTTEDQGELFGIHNIFKFDPKGFVPGNLERVRLAEDRFAQDLIEAEYEDDEEHGYDSEGEAGQAMKKERQNRDQKRALAKAAEEMSMVSDVLGEIGGASSPRKEDNILDVVGVSSHDHMSAFSDSPAERQIYEIGVKLLRSNPDLAKKMKANDLGKIGGRVRKEEKAARSKVVDQDDEPWAARVAAKSGGATQAVKAGTKRVLAELSDDD